MKIEFDELPDGFKVINGQVVEVKQSGGSTGDQKDFGLVTTPKDHIVSDEYNVKYSMAPVPRDEANIEAEKGETVLTDLNGDGKFGLYDIQGKRHARGGTPLFLPEQSFVYSDFNKMKFTKDEMAQMGIESKKKLTPAKISKKFGINEYYASLKDPYADDIQANTADLMLEKNKMQLSKLSLLQEAKKDYEDGVPVTSYPFLTEQGQDPIEFTQHIENINRQKAEEKFIRSLPMEQQMQIQALQQYMAQVDQQQQVQQQEAQQQGMLPPAQEQGMQQMPPQGMQMPPPPGMNPQQMAQMGFEMQGMEEYNPYDMPMAQGGIETSIKQTISDNLRRKYPDASEEELQRSIEQEINYALSEIKRAQESGDYESLPQLLSNLGFSGKSASDWKRDIESTARTQQALPGFDISGGISKLWEGIKTKTPELWEDFQTKVIQEGKNIEEEIQAKEYQNHEDKLSLDEYLRKNNPRPTILAKEKGIIKRRKLTDEEFDDYVDYGSTYGDDNSESIVLQEIEDNVKRYGKYNHKEFINNNLDHKSTEDQIYALAQVEYYENYNDNQKKYGTFDNFLEKNKKKIGQQISNEYFAKEAEETAKYIDESEAMGKEDIKRQEAKEFLDQPTTPQVVTTETDPPESKKKRSKDYSSKTEIAFDPNVDDEGIHRLNIGIGERKYRPVQRQKEKGFGDSEENIGGFETGWEKIYPRYEELMKAIYEKSGKGEIKEVGKFQKWHNNDYIPSVVKKYGEQMKAAGKSWTEADETQWVNKLIKEHGFDFDRKGRAIDYKWGTFTSSRRPFEFNPITQEPETKPDSDTKPGPELDPVVEQEDDPINIKPNELKVPYNPNDPRFWLQDLLKLNAIASRKRKKFYPWQPAVADVDVDYVLEDPTRAIAATNEQMNLMAQGLGSFGGPQSFNSRMANVQGKTAANIANVISGVHNRNINTINRGQAQQSQFDYMIDKENRTRKTKLYDDTMKVEQNALIEENFDREQYADALSTAYSNMANTYNMNTLHDNYNIDPTTGGMMYFTNPKALDPSRSNAQSKMEEYTNFLNTFEQQNRRAPTEAEINYFMGIKGQNNASRNNYQQEMYNKNNPGFLKGYDYLGKKGREVRKLLPFFVGHVGI